MQLYNYTIANQNLKNQIHSLSLFCVIFRLHLEFFKFYIFRHSDKREFLCNECGKTFKRKDKLKEHAKKIHSLQRKTSSMMIMAAASASTRPEAVAEAAPPAPAAAASVVVTSQPAATTPNANANDKFTPRVSTLHLYFF